MLAEIKPFRGRAVTGAVKLPGCPLESDTVNLGALYIRGNHVAFVPEPKHMSASKIVHAPVKGGLTGKPDQEVVADREFVSHEFDNPVNTFVEQRLTLYTWEDIYSPVVYTWRLHRSY